MNNTSKGTTKSGGKKHSLDKFYTEPEVAKYCISKIKLENFATIIEPSAGNGSFSNQIPNIIAFDLEPESEKIIKKDWFTHFEKREDSNPILVIGNPPFGQQNTLAISFINHAARFAHTIAFILPLSFMKESVQEKLDKNLHLVNSFPIPKNSFILEGKSFDVPCIFQVWEYRKEIRKALPSPQLIGFKFVKKNENPDFFLQRIGGNTGNFGSQWQEKSEQSHYFIKATKATISEIEQSFKLLKFPSKEYSVGPKSISKKEILQELLSINSSLVKK